MLWPSELGPSTSGRSWSRSPRRSRSASWRDDRYAGGGEHRLGLGADKRLQLVRLVRKDRRDVADGVGDELAVLPRHDVGPRHRLEAGRAQVGGDALGHLVGAGRVAADVEDAGHRVAALDDHAGLEVLRRQHHRDRVGVGEPAQRGRLVGDTVLRADHRHGPRVRAAPGRPARPRSGATSPPARRRCRRASRPRPRCRSRVPGRRAVPRRCRAPARRRGSGPGARRARPA